MSNFGCELCSAHPDKGDAILRVSPLGGPFIGRCMEHLDTETQRAELAEDIQIALDIQAAIENMGSE